MSRGDRGRPIFKDDLDREMFLADMDKVCERTGWRIHAYVLMPNHWHWLLETPEGNLVDGMKWFLGTYSQQFNARHGERGHVFQGRYKAVVVQTDSGNYFETVSTYIHLNPAKAGLLTDENPELQSYCWSSLPQYLKARQKRPPWLVTDRVLGNLALKDSSRGRSEYREYLQGRMGELRTKAGRREYNALWKPIRHHWYAGSEEFGESLLKHVAKTVSGKQRSSYSGEAVQAHDRAEAEQLIVRGMKALEVTEDALSEWSKGDIRKCALAWLAHSRTMAGHAWIAERLVMGAPSNMTTYIDRIRNAQSKAILRIQNRLKRTIRK